MNHGNKGTAFHRRLPWRWLAVVGLVISPPLWTAWHHARTATSTGTENVTTAVREHAVEEGIAIDFRIEVAGPDAILRQGDTVRFVFEIEDEATGQPISGLPPAAWMDWRAPGEVPSPRQCRDKVETFLGGSLFSRAELDLNAYHVLALNDDATITVVDPLFGFGATKLLALVTLPGVGEDWVVAPGHGPLFVSIPEADQVAAVRTDSWTVAAAIDVGRRPRRVALQADEKYLWVGHEGWSAPDKRAGVTVIDTDRLEAVANIATGRGPHDIALAGNRYAFVTNEGDDSVSVLDIHALEKIKDIAMGQAPVSAALSAVGQALYVAHQDGTLAVVDVARHAVVSRLHLRPGLSQVAFAPGDRFALALNPKHKEIYVVDAAAQRVVQTAKLDHTPDQVAFSDAMAYVRYRDSEQIQMIPLHQMGKQGAPIPVVDFAGGHKAPGGAAPASAASAVVAAPGAAAVLVANPADEAIYYYTEGMAAPMGAFQNYHRRPRAVLAVDHSLKEQAPGVYETTATLRRPGLYDLAFFLDAPRVVRCFEVQVHPAKGSAPGGRPQVEPLIASRTMTAGTAEALRFRVTDPISGEPQRGVRDVNVLAFSPAGRQERQWAVEKTPGLYEVSFLPRSPGVYYIFVNSHSLGLPYQASPRVVLQVLPRAAAVPAPGRRSGS